MERVKNVEIRVELSHIVFLESEKERREIEMGEEKEKEGGQEQNGQIYNFKR